MSALQSAFVLLTLSWVLQAYAGLRLYKIVAEVRTGRGFASGAD